VSIVLRPWREADVEAVVLATADPEIPRWTRVPEQNTAENVRWFFANQEEGELHLAIADEATDEVLGSIGLLRPVAEARRAEVGYWVVAKHRGRGVAAQAVALLARRAFAERDLHRLEIHAHPDNAASRRVAEKAGFRLEGILRGYEELKGRLDDIAMYARLRDD
jgi:RimJ/RimL family protein N-acetyltransferase